MLQVALVVTTVTPLEWSCPACQGHSIRPLNLVEQVCLRLNTCRFLSSEYHVLKVHLLSYLFNLNAASSSEQMVVTFPIALFRCFINIGRWTHQV